MFESSIRVRKAFGSVPFFPGGGTDCLVGWAWSQTAAEPWLWTLIPALRRFKVGRVLVRQGKRVGWVVLVLFLLWIFSPIDRLSLTK